MNKKLCLDLAHISQSHPASIPGTILCHTIAWPRKPAICHELEFQTLMDLWGLASLFTSIYGQTPTSPMLGTRGFMMGREVEAVPVFLGSQHHTALGCFPMASPAHSCQGWGWNLCSLPAPVQNGNPMGQSTMQMCSHRQWGLGVSLGAAKITQEHWRKKVTHSLDGKVCGKRKGEQE